MSKIYGAPNKMAENQEAPVVEKQVIDLPCKINESEFKLSMAPTTPLPDAISAALAYLEYFKKQYVQAIDKSKDNIIDPIKAPTEIVQPELVEAPSQA